MTDKPEPDEHERPRDTAPTANSAMTRDEHMKKLSANPRFKVLPPSGKGYIIPGAKPHSKESDT